MLKMTIMFIDIFTVDSKKIFQCNWAKLEQCYLFLTNLYEENKKKGQKTIKKVISNNFNVK